MRPVWRPLLLTLKRRSRRTSLTPPPLSPLPTQFVSPSPPPCDALPETYNHQEAYRLQLRLFLREVSAQQQLPTLRSFLKLYSTISVAKLAQIIGEEGSTSPSGIREALQCLKHKTHGLLHFSGPPLSGARASSADVDFYVTDDVAHVADTEMTKRHSDYFIRQIAKLDDIIANVNVKAPAAL
jgi:translation initiation factor 3 subunit L